MRLEDDEDFRDALHAIIFVAFVTCEPSEGDIEEAIEGFMHEVQKRFTLTPKVESIPESVARIWPQVEAGVTYLRDK